LQEGADILAVRSPISPRNFWLVDGTLDGRQRIETHAVYRLKIGCKVPNVQIAVKYRCSSSGCPPHPGGEHFSSLVFAWRFYELVSGALALLEKAPSALFNRHSTHLRLAAGWPWSRHGLPLTLRCKGDRNSGESSAAESMCQKPEHSAPRRLFFEVPKGISVAACNIVAYPASSNILQLPPKKIYW
jgi:hypothetical protein